MIQGIVFNVIIARVHQGRTIDQTNASASTVILAKRGIRTGSSTANSRQPHRLSTTGKRTDTIFTLEPDYPKIVIAEEAVPESESSAVGF